MKLRTEADRLRKQADKLEDQAMEVEEAAWSILDNELYAPRYAPANVKKACKTLRDWIKSEQRRSEKLDEAADKLHDKADKLDAKAE